MAHVADLFRHDPDKPFPGENRSEDEGLIFLRAVFLKVVEYGEDYIVSQKRLTRIAEHTAVKDNEMGKYEIHAFSAQSPLNQLHLYRVGIFF